MEYEGNIQSDEEMDESTVPLEIAEDMDVDTDGDIPPAPEDITEDVDDTTPDTPEGTFEPT